MALARKCDICGELYEYYAVVGGFQYNTIAFENLNILKCATSVSDKRMDVCPKCMKSISDHIHSLKGDDDKCEK